MQFGPWRETIDVEMKVRFAIFFPKYKNVCRKVIDGEKCANSASLSEFRLNNSVSYIQDGTTDWSLRLEWIDLAHIHLTHTHTLIVLFFEIQNKETRPIEFPKGQESKLRMFKWPSEQFGRAVFNGYCIPWPNEFTILNANKNTHMVCILIVRRTLLLDEPVLGEVHATLCISRGQTVKTFEVELS